MKKSLFISMILLCASAFSQTKTWKQTSVADFASGAFDRVVSTAVSDGELQLIHPLVRVGNDTLDSSIPRFVCYDDAGNSLQAWTSSKTICVQKFNSLRQPTSPVINVDANVATDTYRIGLALLNDGRFVVGWLEEVDSLNHYSYYMRYCQFFDSSNTKAGNRILVFNLNNASASTPLPFADQKNQRFVIIGTEGNGTAGFKSYACIFGPSGIKLRDSIRIAPSSATKNEFTLDGAFHDGKFAFVWSGTNGNTSSTDTYFMLADSNCIPLMDPVKVNDNAPKGDLPSVGFDDAGNCLVIWNWNPYVVPGPPGILYGRILDFSGRKIGGVLQLTSLQSGTVYWQKIAAIDGKLRITFMQTFSNGLPSQQWVSYRKMLLIN